MCVEAHDRKRKAFVVDAATHPQTLAVVATRAARSASRSASARGAGRLGRRRRRRGVLLSVPDHRRHDRRRPRADRRGPRRRREGGRGHRPARADRAHAAGRARRRHRDRLGAALRRADGLRRPARGVPGDHRRLPRLLPGRIIGVSKRRHRAAGLPAGAADPRAAHPPREGDEQHLHRAGAAGGHGRRCTPSTTAPRACARSRARARLDRGARRRPDARLGTAPRAGAFFDTLRVDLDAHARPRCSPAALERGSTCAATPTASAWPRRDHQRRRRRRAARVLRRRRAAVRARRADRRPTPPALPAGLGRTSAFLTHRCSTARSASTTCCATCTASRAGPVADHVDDPARLVHDEAQRHHRDDPGDLARVRPLHPFAPVEQTGGYRALFTTARGVAGRDHRLRRGVAAAQRRRAGRVRRPAGDPRLPRGARRHHRDVCLIPT
jgi:hypothetical protein